MTLFSWFNRIEQDQYEQLITIKPVELNQISMWPVAKIKYTNALADHSKFIDEDNVIDEHLNAKD